MAARNTTARNPAKAYKNSLAISIFIFVKHFVVLLFPAFTLQALLGQPPIASLANRLGQIGDIPHLPILFCLYLLIAHLLLL